MSNILIPTDFTVKSLDILTDYLLMSDIKDISLLFFSGIKLSDSISDLLLLSRRTKEVELIPKSFDNYCKCLQREFKTIKIVRFEYFYGNTMALFRNFLEANKINEIVYDPTIKLQKITKASLDITSIINKVQWKKWTPSAQGVRNKISSKVNVGGVLQIEEVTL